jgi:hypothetical protein
MRLVCRGPRKICEWISVSSKLVHIPEILLFLSMVEFPLSCDFSNCEAYFMIRFVERRGPGVEARARHTSLGHEHGAEGSF